MENTPVRLIKRKRIDERSWNACIERSGTGLIYPHIFYLDHLADHWDALVMGDYEAVMPLTWKSRFGLKYLYQPPFTQQLGIFCAVKPPPELIERFLREANKHFLFAEIFLNHTNSSDRFQRKTNYILSLRREYHLILEGYRPELKRLVKGEKFGDLVYHQPKDHVAAVAMYRELYGKRMPHVRRRDYEQLSRLCWYASTRGLLEVREALDRSGKVVAGILLLKSEQRLHLIGTYILPSSRATRANHFLIDGLIREFSARDQTLDFEGSSIPGVAFFFESFGPEKEDFYFYRHNRLPWPLHYLKPS